MFQLPQVELLASTVDAPLVTHQLECSLLAMDALHDGTLDQCQRLRTAPMAWSPFAGGRLFTSDDERAVRARAALAAVGRELGDRPPDQVALAWLLRHPARIVPVLGTGRADRIRSAAEAESIELSREQWYALCSASTGHEVP